MRASFSVQKEADIDHADLIIAVTDSDELNLLCCTVAKRVGNCSAIARVRTPDYSMEANYLRERLIMVFLTAWVLKPIFSRKDLASRLVETKEMQSPRYRN